jgi:beta-lactamase regulating signal transducer with metallopeptidase domain
MIDWLLTATLKGSLVFLLVAGANRVASHWMRARWRRLWWLLVPLAFLCPVQIPSSFPVPAGKSVPLAILASHAEAAAHDLLVAAADVSHPSARLAPWLLFVWLGGAAVSGLGVVVPTWRAHRAWSGLRVSTDPRLLNLLEDAKAEAGVTAPIGLIVSDALAAPALLGWLRPRLLLPRAPAENASCLELQAIFLHELAHFRALDIPLNWLFVLARALHWFNPLAYAANALWARFREEAADEAAIGWLKESDARGYGEILLKTLGQCSGGAVPMGALAIGESLVTLKRRMLMIRTYPSKSGRAALAGVVAVLLVASTALLPVLAQNDAEAAKKDAAAAMETWLAEIDAGSYAQSWSDSAKSFQGAITSDKWVSALHTVREPLGKLVSRNLDSSLYQTEIPHVGNTPEMKGPFVIAQFDASFENLKYAVETVTFQQGDDGTWRAAGYYIKPKL